MLTFVPPVFYSCFYNIDALKDKINRVTINYRNIPKKNANKITAPTGKAHESMSLPTISGVPKGIIGITIASNITVVSTLKI